MTGSKADHYFSPRTNAGEMLDSHSDLNAADGGTRPISGGAPFRQPCSAYPFA